jgi:hypothetical protein
MGRRRTNPKYLRMVRQKRSGGIDSALKALFHGNPKGLEGSFITDDNRVISTEDIKDPVSTRRAKVLATKELWQSDFHQHVHQYCYIKVVGLHYIFGLKRFFSGEKTFFQEETDTHIRRSVVYSTKYIAMMAFDSGRITWIETIPRYPTPPSTAPPKGSG